MALLQRVQTLQFSDKTAAEALLLEFLRTNYSFSVDAVAVELRPLAVSLNSFNGFMTLENGQRYFFKTHIESDGVIDEYYHAALWLKPAIRCFSLFSLRMKLVSSCSSMRSSAIHPYSISPGKSRTVPAICCPSLRRLKIVRMICCFSFI